MSAAPIELRGRPAGPTITVDDDDEVEKAWMQDAACRGADPELFFPVRGETTYEAKAVCAGCPVRFECLEYALRHSERFGIWGGLGERERRRLRQARGINNSGRPLFSPSERRRIAALDQQGRTDSDIASEMGCTIRTVQRVLTTERQP
jgi:WhiB family redox-sensing transcriptional regulator